MKFPTYDHKHIATEILKFWQDNNTTQKLRDRNKNGQKFYFLEGPPYTSGKVHLGTAWNMGLKDMTLRYKRMKGFNVWDRMGYDMHGLPTEQKVMKKLGLKNKEDIDTYGVKKFTDECEKFCKEMMELMNLDFVNMGATLDFSYPYQPITKEFIEGEWWFIQKAYENGRLYQGLRTMHWDSATQTAVAKHELEYKQLRDTSIFVKLQDCSDENVFYVIWTTTPWTIPLNLAVMVNPEMEYVKVKVENEEWVVAESLLEQVMEKAGVQEYEVVSRMSGADLEGKHYVHPLGVKEFLPTKLQENPKLYSILVSKEYVDDSAGTGLVHCAPGCGPEDYEVGHANKIPPFNCVNEAGYFEELGKFSGWKAKTDDNKFISAIKDADALVAKESYVHDYPHGERSHEPVIFRTTKQWFFKVEDLKEQMLENNKEIYWHPQAAKNAFNSWLENLRDNSITKQRYWGTPVPIWMAEGPQDKDAKPDVIVVGSVAELEELSGQKVENLHIPDIDKIVIEKDGKTYRRIPDVLDVWIDAGSASWNCLNFPQDKETFDEWFPADFILEGKDQIRGWFNLLMVGSTLAFGKAPFKNVFMHGFLNDSSGVKMSKSLGNIITPDELLEKHGADVMRYYMSATSAGEDNNFSWEECAARSRNLNIVWNVHKLLINTCKENSINPTQIDDTSEAWLEEKYINSVLHSTIKKVTELMDVYRLDEVISPLENLFLELSRTYIQSARDKLATGSEDEKKVVVKTMFTVLFECIKMFNVVAPFICEAMYLNLKEEFSLSEESIGHCSWPKFDSTKVDVELEENVRAMQSIVSGILNAREKAKLGLRWPVKEVIVESKNERIMSTVAELSSVIEREANTKTISAVDTMEGVEFSVSPNAARIGKSFGKLSKEIMNLINSQGEEILSGIEETGTFKCEVAGEEVILLKEHLVTERSVKEPFVFAESKNFVIYLNTERNTELEAEGFSREVTRRVQQLRKNAGMEKQERISLEISCEKEMQGMLEKFMKEMQEKVGANSVVFVENVSLEHQDAFKVKGNEFSVGFVKV